MTNPKVPKVKIIKDSVHGYIEVEEHYMRLFVDTPYFQRLRRIEQTSMRVLYPSARHDRFIHSIGTFSLGRKAFKYFKNNFVNEFTDLFPNRWDQWETSFAIACLLHDVGHAPFSHTCENFFAQKMVELDAGARKIPFINQQLLIEMKIALCNSKYIEFERDFNSSTPSPHEIVSSIVILKLFTKDIKSIKGDIELIIRAILGCTYLTPNKEKGLKNCLIRMLNSPVIDVDKLDYIIRDTALTGFDNVSIDTDRLLRSFTAVKENENDYYPAYKKNALSVIQNVIAANNAQQAWIVNHPVVVYDSYLVQTAIREIAKIICPTDPSEWINKMFSVESIVDKVDCFGFNINMLCDNDLWHLFKQYSDNVEEINELLNRNIRKRGIWKSLAEFSMLFDDGKANPANGEYCYNKFVSLFNNACSVSENFNNYLCINPADTENANEDYEACSAIMENFIKQYRYKNKHFVILPGGEPQKNKAVIARDKLRIQFSPGPNGTKRYNEVMKHYPHAIQSAPLNPTIEMPKISTYFYLYYTRDKKEIEKDDFCNFIKNNKIFKYVAPTERV